jgi:hypothetical protein
MLAGVGDRLAFRRAATQKYMPQKSMRRKNSIMRRMAISICFPFIFRQIQRFLD